MSLSLVFYHDFFFWAYMYHISSSFMQLSSGWTMSTGWGGQGLGRRKQRQKKPLCQPSLGTLRACMAEDQAHYMGTFFLMAKCIKILKVKLYARNCWGALEHLLTESWITVYVKMIMFKNRAHTQGWKWLWKFPLSMYIHMPIHHKNFLNI